jgi:hypothetical protein
LQTGKKHKGKGYEEKWHESSFSKQEKNKEKRIIKKADSDIYRVMDL